MRSFLSNAIEYLRRTFYKKEKSKFYNMDRRSVFNDIYSTNHWKSNESVSGRGSTLKQTKHIISELEKLIEKFAINRIADIPCGDFNWMKHLNLDNLKYVGGDIVKSLIEKNNNIYKDFANIEFREIDIIDDPIGCHDLIISRDCLVHFSYLDINKALMNIIKSEIPYLLTTTFPDHQSNSDITTGDWRPINLNASPFNFPDPVLIINENCTEGAGVFSDKSLALWRVKDLKSRLQYE